MECHLRSDRSPRSVRGKLASSSPGEQNHAFNAAHKIFFPLLLLPGFVNIPVPAYYCKIIFKL